MIVHGFSRNALRCQILVYLPNTGALTVKQFSRIWVGRGYLVLVTGFTWVLYEIYVTLLLAKTYLVDPSWQIYVKVWPKH